MEIELLEIRQFLAGIIPFNSLTEELLQKLPGQLQIRYLRRGTTFPPTDASGDFLYILRSGAVELRSGDALHTRLAEGDIYGDCHLIYAPDAKGYTLEDTLLYQLPCERLQVLRGASPEFDSHFTESFRERLRQAANRVHVPADISVSHMTVEVGELLKKPAVAMRTDSTIQQVAQAMADKHVSSVMLMEDDALVGLVTDRDLRGRCVAVGLPVDRPVREIMSRKLHTIDHHSLTLHALVTMTRFQLHHLPVIQDDKVVGMITATDLNRLSSNNSALIVADIREAQSLDELFNSCWRLPELQLQLANASVTADHIGEMVSYITDALTIRLIEFAQTELGSAPVPFVWVAGGSQGRREQTTHSDQDSALIISDEMQPEDEDYFAALAKRISDGMNACGFVYCPGEAMATNSKWRQPLRVWRNYFRNWIDNPEPMALMLSSIFFDLRPIYGEADLFEQLQHETLARSRDAGIFIAHMAANALTHRPPLGFFRAFVLIHDGKHDETFDIKHRGIVPITDIARLLSLSQGLREINTTERLRAVAGTTAMSSEMAENLQDALAFIAGLRIRHQANQIAKGHQPDNYLPPDALSELERKHLKDAFRIIKIMQEIIEQRYQTGSLG